MRVAVVGIGKLGAPLAAVLASKENDVLAVDLNPEAVRLMHEGRAPVDEPGLQELISRSRERLRATSDFAALADREVIILLVPTPSEEDGAFSNAHVLAAVEAMGPALHRQSDYQVLVVASTVMPGSCESAIQPALERVTGRRVGESLGLCYSPEFVALGSVIRDMLEPDMVVIGESDPRAGGVLERLYSGVHDNDPPFRHMNLVNAELTKVAVAAYVTMKISYANVLADLCERLPGARADTVADVLGFDTRIGRKCLQGGVPYGGPCYPRDPKAFSALAHNVGANPALAEATHAINVAQFERLARIVRSRLTNGSTVGILGLSFKPQTDVIEKSPGVALATLLAQDGYAVHVHDPASLNTALRTLPSNVHGDMSIRELLECSDVVVISTPWPEFGSLPLDSFARGEGRRLVVIDCWGVLAHQWYGDAVDIVRLGRGATTDSDLASVASE